MIALNIVIDQRSTNLFDVRPSAAVAPTEAEQVIANIVHHVLKLAGEEIAEQIAAEYLRCDAEVIARMTRRPSTPKA